MQEDIPELASGIVKARFLAGVLDGTDPGDEPDGAPMKGTVTFTATTPSLKLDSATHSPVTVYLTSLTVALDEEGYLSHNGSREIRLWATNNPEATPINWQWKVTARLRHNDARDGNVEFKGFNFALPGGATIDLTTASPVSYPSPGTVVTRGPRGEQGPRGDDGPRGDRGTRWYLSNTVTPDPVSVTGMQTGDIFCYPASGDVFWYDGDSWEYSGVLTIANVGA